MLDSADGEVEPTVESGAPGPEEGPRRLADLAGGAGG